METSTGDELHHASDNHAVADTVESFNSITKTDFQSPLHFNNTRVNINRIMIYESLKEPMLREICDELLKVHEYKTVWITLENNFGEITSISEAGIERNVREFENCLRDYLGTSKPAEINYDNKIEVINIKHIEPVLSGNRSFNGCDIWTVGIKDKQSNFGRLSAMVEKSPEKENELKGLFFDTAVSVGFGLAKLELVNSYRKNEERLRALVDTRNDWFWEIDSEGKFTYCSPGVKELLGYSPNDLLEKPIFDLLISEDIWVDQQKFKDLFTAEKSFRNYKNVYLGKDDALVPLETTGSPIFDTHGEFIGFRGIDTDPSMYKDTLSKLLFNQEKLRLFMDSVTEAFTIWDSDFTLVEINKAALDFLPPSTTREDVIGKSFSDFGQEKYEEVYQKVIDTGEPHFSEDKIKLPWYGEVFLESKGFKLGDGLGLMITDITERKQGEESLRQSRDEYQTLTANIPGIVYRIFLRENHRMQFFNQMLHPLTGYSEEELVEGEICSFENFIHDDDKSWVVFQVREALKDNRPFEIVYRFHHKNGLVKHFHEMGRPISDIEGNPLYVDGMILDITDKTNLENLTLIQKELAIDLSHATDLDSALAKCIDAGIKVSGMDSGGVYLFEEETGDLVLKYSKGLGDVFINAVSRFPQDSPHTQVVLTAKPIHSMHQDFDLPMESEEVKEGIKALSVIPVSFEGKVIGCINIASHSILDIPDSARNALETIAGQVGGIISRIKAGNALLKSEEKYRNIVENSLEGMCIVQDNEIKFCNQRFADMFGYDHPGEPIGLQIDNFVAEDSLKEVFNEIDLRQTGQKEISHYHFKACRKNGTIFEVETLGSIAEYQGRIATQSVMRDVSEQRQLEAQLLQAQKMESIGRLAGGIAHDFNNLLTAITGTSELILLNLDENSPISKDVNLILDTADRAAHLTRQLLAFSRKQVIQPRIVNLNDILVNMEKILRRLIGEDVELKFEKEENLYPVKVDPGQMEQVIVNLAVNARDAMPKGGKLTITTENITQKETTGGMFSQPMFGEFILVTISDNGMGMDRDTATKIFEPFFTTKSKEKGTGLGLSTVYGIVKQNKGSIVCHSVIDEGTTFKIFLPVFRGADVAEQEEEKETADRQGTETVLLVEDEETVRNLTTRSLERFGYQVYACSSAEEALVKSNSMEKPVDLVITDVVLPNMSGRDLVDKMLSCWKEIKVLFISGYSEEMLAQQGVLEEEFNYMAKPFKPQFLLDKVRSILDK